MSRPDEVPKWARCEHQGDSLVDWGWTDGDGWRHLVCADSAGKVWRRYERASDQMASLRFPGSPMEPDDRFPGPPMEPDEPSTDHTVVLVGVDQGVPQWELGCDHDGDVDDKCNVQSWWSEEGIHLVDIPVLGVRFPVRPTWHHSGGPTLITPKDANHE